MGTVMAKRPKDQEPAEDEKPKEDRSGRKTAPVQIDKDLAHMAAVIASYRGITQSQVCSPALRPHLTAQYRLIQEEMAQELREGKGGGKG